MTVMTGETMPEVTHHHVVTSEAPGTTTGVIRDPTTRDAADIEDAEDSIRNRGVARGQNLLHILFFSLLGPHYMKIVITVYMFMLVPPT